MTSRRLKTKGEINSPPHRRRICNRQWLFLCWSPWAAERPGRVAPHCGCSLRSRSRAFWGLNGRRTKRRFNFLGFLIQWSLMCVVFRRKRSLVEDLGVGVDCCWRELMTRLELPSH